MLDPSATRPYLILGSQGMLGQALSARLMGRATALGRESCDITAPSQIESTLTRLQPRTVINCAAWTDVDGAEAQPAAAHAVNAEAVGTLARMCAARGIHLLTISTDYVFKGEGDQPYPEDAPAEHFGPRNVYGASKLAGEQAVAEAGGSWCIARTQWLYGANGRNFVDTMARLGKFNKGESVRVVNDQVGAPTWVADAADALLVLAEAQASGYYHVVAAGEASWFDVARHIFAHLRLDTPLVGCSTAEMPRPAQRPANSRLDQSRLTAVLGRPMRPWREALDEYLNATYPTNR